MLLRLKVILYLHQLTLIITLADSDKNVTNIKHPRSDKNSNSKQPPILDETVTIKGPYGPSVLTRCQFVNGAVKNKLYASHNLLPDYLFLHL